MNLVNLCFISVKDCVRRIGRRRWAALAATGACVFAILRTGGLLSDALFAQSTCSDTVICSTGVFCSGFEEGSKAVWDDYDGNPDSTNQLLSDPGPCNKSGNHVMHFKPSGAAGTGADLIKVLPGSYDKLYLRWYQKWDTGYDFSAPGHGSGLHAGSRDLLGVSGNRPTGSDFFAAYLEPISQWGSLDGRPHLYTYYRGMYQDCSDPNSNCFGDSLPCMYDEGSGYCTNPAHRETVTPPAFTANKWYCLEMMIDGGTPTTSASGANGSENFWIDDTQYGPWGGLWMRTTANLKLTTLWLNLFRHEANNGAGITLDDVVVSTTRIGCFGGGGTPRAPAAPTNVRIIQ